MSFSLKPYNNYSNHSPLNPSSSYSHPRTCVIWSSMSCLYPLLFLPRSNCAIFHFPTYQVHSHLRASDIDMTNISLKFCFNVRSQCDLPLPTIENSTRQHSFSGISYLYILLSLFFFHSIYYFITRYVIYFFNRSVVFFMSLPNRM